MEQTPKTQWARPVVYFEIGAKDELVLIPFYKQMFNWDIGDGPIIEFQWASVAQRTALVAIFAEANTVAFLSTSR
jgi:hypothetical protein